MNWNNARAEWVNGEQAEVIESIRNISKLEFAELMLEALKATYKGIHKNTHTGDLTDLIEILTAYINWVPSNE